MDKTIAYFPNNMAFQSEPVWKAFLHGCKKLGLEPIENSMDADCVMIWSVLWYGRLLPNQKIYQHYRNLNKPVFIIEVGSLHRGITWKLAVNSITNKGIYPVTAIDRSKKLNVVLQQPPSQRNESILIATQHEHSLQWEGNPTMNEWCEAQLTIIRNLSERYIVIRHHPRWPIQIKKRWHVRVEFPKKLENTYDLFDISYNHHCIINHNSGPGVQAIIAGTPVITHETSLAYPMSSTYEDIDNIKPLDQDQRRVWLKDICNTEWLVEEIEEGIPLRSLLSQLDNNLKTNYHIL